MPTTLPTVRPVTIRSTSRTALLDGAATPGRLALAGVLGWAALAKITDPAATVRSVRAYRLLPDTLATAFGRGLPSAELALAVLLVLGVALRATATATAMLLAVFTAGIASAAARGLRIDCGCFGTGGPTAHPHYTGEIARDTALVALSAALAVHGRSRFALAPRAPEPVEVTPAGNSVRAEAAAELRHRRSVARHRRVQQMVGAAAVGSVVLSAAVGVAVGTATAPGAPIAIPAGVTPAGGIVVGSPTAKHTVIAYEDPQCPVCGQFERISGPTLAAAIAAGEVKVEYRMRSFLGPESVRADAALGAAQQEGKFAALRDAMFAHQPTEHTGGYTIDDLITLGASVGLTDARYMDAVRDQTYAGWAREVDDRASRDGDTGTPELILDGQELPSSVVFDPAALQGALNA